MQVDELQIPKLQAQVLITFNNNNKMFNNVCFLLALCACDLLCVCACLRLHAILCVFAMFCIKMFVNFCLFCTLVYY